MPWRFIFAMCASIAVCAVQAQDVYPSKPIRLVIGFAPGGGSDISGRIIARKVSELLGQQIIIDNRPGAGGNIATDMVAKAAPDGYTILMGSVGPLAVAPHMSKNLPFDPQKDLAPISLGVTFANVLVVHPSVPVKNLQEYVALAKTKPIPYGTSGIGSAGHLAGELFRMMAGVDIPHVPYKGGGPAMNDALGGQVPSLFASAPTALPQIQAGKLRALATTGSRRSALLPNVPTIAESGYPGYEAMNWYAFLAPAKTPRPIIDKLNREFVKALNSPDVREQLARDGAEAIPSTPEEFAAYMARESRTWAKVVKEAGITTD
jgi:tripartite-type tricarboxylate transporter receptor subunit TctC